MSELAPSRYWVIRHTPSDSTVAKFDTNRDRIIPDEITDHGDFSIQKLSDRSALILEDVDQSGLSAEEKDILSLVYPIVSE